MIKKVATLLLPALLLIGSVITRADDDFDEIRGSGIGDQWHLIKFDRRNNMRAWDKREEGNRFRSFKLDLIVNAPLESVARAYWDIDYYSHWFWEVMESRILKKVSDTEFYYYVVHRAPVGLPPRDAILRAQITPWNAKLGYASYRLTAQPDYLPPRAGMVRMLAEDMLFKWTPQTDGNTRLEVEGYIDPGGLVPVWAINFIQRQAPYYTALGLQRVVKTERFKTPKEPMPFRLRE